MSWTVTFVGGGNLGTRYFNGGASFLPGVYKILASGWYTHWGGGCPSPGCPDETGIDGCMNAWCNRIRSIGSGDFGMHIIYGGIDSPVRDLRVELGVIKLNHPGGPIGIWDKDEGYSDNSYGATYILEIDCPTPTCNFVVI